MTNFLAAAIVYYAAIAAFACLSWMAPPSHNAVDDPVHGEPQGANSRPNEQRNDNNDC